MSAEEKRNITVFYDHPCADGAASAWCFFMKYGQDPEINLNLVPLAHGKEEVRAATVKENVTSPDDEVYFLRR